MMIIMYLIIGLVITFLVYKKDYDAELKKSKFSPYYNGHRLDNFESAVKGVAIGATWLISIPLILVWRLMDRIYNKFNKTNN